MTIPRPDQKMLDDLARVAGGAVNVFSGLQEQISNDIRTRMEELATRLDLVPRDDLDHALGMIETLRRTVKGLEARVDNLEGKKEKPKAAAAGKAKAKADTRNKVNSRPKAKKK